MTKTLPQLDSASLAILRPAINRLWGSIGSEIEMDCEELGEPLDNAGAAEIVLDAERLLRFSLEANELVHTLCEVHGYSAVHRWIARHIQLV